MTNELLEIAEEIEEKSEKEVINRLRKIMNRNDQKAFKNSNKEFQFKNSKFNSFE